MHKKVKSFDSKPNWKLISHWYVEMSELIRIILERYQRISDFISFTNRSNGTEFWNLLYNTFQNSVPFDWLVNEIWSQKFRYLFKIFLINSDIPIYEWLMNFELALDLDSHYTWVAIKSLSLNRIFLVLSCWSSGQSGSLIQAKGLRI